MNKNLILLALVFSFTFFGFNSAQSFVTSYFLDIWHDNAWFYSLSLIYLFFLISNIFFVWHIKKLGSKKSILFSLLFYSFYVFSLVFKSVIFLYISSALIWLAAAFLWVWQQTYLIDISSKNNLWKNSWIFNLFFFFSSATWVLSMWFMIEYLDYFTTFLIFWFFPLLSILVWSFLKDYSKDEKIEINTDISKFRIFKNKDLFIIWAFLFSMEFLSALFISIIPIHIKELLWVEYIWIYSFIYLILITLFSFFVWKSVDKHDIRKIIVFMFLLSLISMVFFYFYKVSSFFILIWVLLMAIKFAYSFPVVSSIVSKLSSKDTREKFSSLFLVYKNAWVIMSIFIASFVSSENIYLLWFIIILFSFILYMMFLYKKSFAEIKKDISL